MHLSKCLDLPHFAPLFHDLASDGEKVQQL